MSNLNGKKKYETVDLYAGVGGIRLGFESTRRFKTVFANDKNPYCKATYDRNFKSSKLEVGDIGDLEKYPPAEFPAFDFLLAGFPCQPFSVAGYRKGFEDEGRGNQFFNILRLIKAKRPTGFLLENVKNMRTHDRGRTFRVIEEALREAGYFIKAEVLNTMDYGNLPQNRERIYIVGFDSEQVRDRFHFPKKVRLTRTFHDFLEDEVPDRVFYEGTNLWPKIKDKIKRTDTVYQYRRVYVRENKKGVCPTLTANMGTGGHNVPIINDGGRIRKLSPKECFALQGFPKNFELPTDLAPSRLYEQAGNSVSVPVIARVARQIIKAVETEDNVLSATG